MKDSKGNTLCVVAGGDYGTCILDTVEILDTSRIDEGWSWGPTLPFKLYGSPMVTSPSGKGVVIVGGYNASTMKYSKALLELKSTTMEWVLLEQKLQIARFRHVAFPIPNELTTVIDYNQPLNVEDDTEDLGMDESGWRPYP